MAALASTRISAKSLDNFVVGTHSSHPAPCTKSTPLVNSPPATDGKRIVELFGLQGLDEPGHGRGKELWNKDLGSLPTPAVAG